VPPTSSPADRFFPGEGTASAAAAAVRVLVTSAQCSAERPSTERPSRKSRKSTYSSSSISSSSRGCGICKHKYLVNLCVVNLAFDSIYTKIFSKLSTPYLLWGCKAGEVVPYDHGNVVGVGCMCAYAQDVFVDLCLAFLASRSIAFRYFGCVGYHSSSKFSGSSSSRCSEITQMISTEF
jgi:hypothetical protein